MFLKNIINSFLKKNREWKNYNNEAEKILKSLNTLKLSYEQKGFYQYIYGKIENLQIVTKDDYKRLKQYKKEIICLKDTKFKTSKEKEVSEKKQLAKDCIFLLEEERETLLNKTREFYKDNKDKFSEEEVELIKTIKDIDNENFLKFVKTSVLKGINMELNMKDFYFLYSQKEEIQTYKFKDIKPFIEIRNRNISRL